MGSGLRSGLFRSGRLGEEGTGKRVGRSGRVGGFVFAKHAVDEGAEFQFLENPSQRFLVRLFADEGLHVELDGDIGLDGGQEFGEDNLLPVRLDLRLQGALQLVGVGQQVLDAAELGDEFLCRLLAYMSMTCRVDWMSNFALTSSVPITSKPPVCLGRYMKTCSPTSWP